MSDAELMLAQFHAALGDERGRGNAALRLTLHKEEHSELIDELRALAAFERGDLILDTDLSIRERLARELADILYVAYGTAHAFAIDLDAALAEVHRAAMSKLNPTCERCRGTGLDPVGDCQVVALQCDSCHGTGDGERVVREDGKILKPEGFITPNMAAAIK